MKFFKTGMLALACSCLLLACNNNEQPQDEAATAENQQTPRVNVPAFNADHAYAHIKTQLDFGPRVPGTPAQKNCADWMQQQLRQYCDTVYLQQASVRGGDGKMLPCYNVIGAIHPEATRRILLLTHWDSRPWADQDPDAANRSTPVPAADDGASGVGVLLEIARILKENPLSSEWGVDIFFTDVEDYGRNEWGEDSYALGTQYWAKHPHVPGYKAQAGILLDMVGGRNARFPLEEISRQYARDVQQEVWAAASRAGYSSYFLYQAGGGITDDHKYVNEMTGIPTIDIIHLRNDTRTGFASHWHTLGDDLSIIDKNTLKAVGQTVLQYLYEKATPPAVAAR